MIVSHNLHDVFEVADRITVLRLGRNVGVYERRDDDEQEIVQAITAGDGHGRQGSRGVSTAAPAEVQAAADGDSLGAACGRAGTALQGRRRRQPAGDRRDRRDHRLFTTEDADLLHRGQLRRT